MKKTIRVLAILLLLASFVGCSGQQDSLKSIYQDPIEPRQRAVDYEVNLGKEVSEAILTAELWTNGVCTKSTPLILNHETKKITLLFSFDGKIREGIQDLQIQIDTDQTPGAFLTEFELPQRIFGYGFTANQDQEVLPVTAGTEWILAAMPFDTGAGISSAGCADLNLEPERLNDNPCLVVIRAAFSAEETNPQSEANP